MPKWKTALNSGAQFCINESKQKREGLVGILDYKNNHWKVVIGHNNNPSGYYIPRLDHRLWINVYNFKRSFWPKKGLTVSFTLVHAYYLGFAGSTPIELAFDVEKLE